MNKISKFMIGIILILTVLSFYLVNEMGTLNNDTEVMNSKLHKQTKELTRLTDLEKQNKLFSMDELEIIQTKEEVSEQNKLFLNAAFNYSTEDERSENMFPFLNDTLKKLFEESHSDHNQASELSVKTSIDTEVTYLDISSSSEVNVLSIVTPRYSSDQLDYAQKIMMFATYQQEKGAWIVTNLEFKEFPK